MNMVPLGAAALQGLAGALQGGAVGGGPPPAGGGPPGAGGVAGVAQQLAAGLAAALQQGGQGNIGPGVHVHQFAIPLGNLNLPPGPGNPFAGPAGPVPPGQPQWQPLHPAGLNGPPNPNGGDGDNDVIQIPPDSQMSSYLRVLRAPVGPARIANASLRAAELRLCWAMAMDTVQEDGESAAAAAADEQAVLRRWILPGDLYASVAEHLQPARVALMLHRRSRELTDGSWHRR